jgi:hypothetical protein
MYGGSKWVARRIDAPAQRRFIVTLLDFVDVNAPRRRPPSPDTLRALFARIGP